MAAFAQASGSQSFSGKSGPDGRARDPGAFDHEHVGHVRHPVFAAIDLGDELVDTRPADEGNVLVDVGNLLMKRVTAANERAAQTRETDAREIVETGPFE